MTWRALAAKAWLLVHVKWWVWRQKHRRLETTPIWYEANYTSKLLEEYYKGLRLGLDIPFGPGTPLEVGPRPEDYIPSTIRDLEK